MLYFLFVGLVAAAFAHFRTLLCIICDEIRSLWCRICIIRGLLSPAKKAKDCINAIIDLGKVLLYHKLTI
jgi:hypothetical protein